MLRLALQTPEARQGLNVAFLLHEEEAALIDAWRQNFRPESVQARIYFSSKKKWNFSDSAHLPSPPKCSARWKRFETAAIYRLNTQVRLMSVSFYGGETSRYEKMRSLMKMRSDDELIALRVCVRSHAS